MIPLQLHGGSRAITQIKFNREGDLLFTASKDASSNVWYSANGERLGSYNGHTGTIFSHDVSFDSQSYVTASGDFQVKLWCTETGQCIDTVDLHSPQNSVEFSASANLVLLSSEGKMGFPSRLMLFDVRDHKKIGDEEQPRWCVPLDKKIMSDFCICRWGPNCNTIIAGHSNGDMSIWDSRNGEMLLKKSVHSNTIKDMQFRADKSLLITASKDCSAKLVSPLDFQVLTTFQTERPVNSASISSSHNHVLLGGGEEAQQVTQTAGNKGKFEARLFHSIYGDEFGRIKGHFGPINSLAFTPDGQGFASGAEDGYVRLMQFESSYLNFSLDYEE